jgi:putative transposase
VGVSIVNIIVHVIMATKGWQPVMTDDMCTDIMNRLVRNFKMRDTQVLAIHCAPEHVHALIKLPSFRALSDVVGWTKGECSHWYNTNHENKLYWQKGYWAAAVSVEEVQKAEKYIASQADIHKKISFEKEMTQFRAFRITT